MIALNQKLQIVEAQIQQLNVEINEANSMNIMCEKSKTLNEKLVEKHTLQFKLSQLAKKLPILGYELEAQKIAVENNPKTNKST